MSWLLIIELIATLLMTLSQFFAQRPPTPASASSLEQRMDTIPDFASKPYLTVFYGFPFSEKDMELYNFIKNDPEMQKIVKQVNLTQYNMNFGWVKNTEWGKYLDKSQRPVIVLQEPSDSTGRAKIVYFRSGDKVLVKESLPKELQAAIDKMGLELPATSDGCRDGACPRIQIEPGRRWRLLRTDD